MSMNVEVLDVSEGDDGDRSISLLIEDKSEQQVFTVLIPSAGWQRVVSNLSQTFSSTEAEERAAADCLALHLHPIGEGVFEADIDQAITEAQHWHHQSPETRLT